MNKSKENKVLKAKIIGLWGDPGLSEYFHYDILSRFLIVQIEPFEECVTNVRKTQMIHLVLRPKSLWIRVQNGANPAGTIRRDFFGNLNHQNITGAGSATPNLFNNSNNGLHEARYLAENIQPISPSYKIGDEITIAKLETSLKPGLFFENVNIFASEDPRAKTPADAFMSNRYRELESGEFPININIAKHFTPVNPNATLGAGALRIGGLKFANTSNAYFRAYYKNLKKLTNKEYKLTKNFTLQNALSMVNSNNNIKAHKGLFGGAVADTMLFESITYQDMNIEGRKRLETSSCVPLVVVNPSTFPTPATRNTGGINITL